MVAGPRAVVGAVDVTVVATAGGTSTTSAADLLSYVTTPIVSAITADEHQSRHWAWPQAVRRCREVPSATWPTPGNVLWATLADDRQQHRHANSNVTSPGQFGRKRAEHGEKA